MGIGELINVIVVFSLPFVFLFIGFYLERKLKNERKAHHDALEREYRTKTKCKFCGKRDFTINRINEITTREHDLGANEWPRYHTSCESKRRYLIYCKSCKNIIYDKTFYSKSGWDREEGQVIDIKSDTVKDYGTDVYWLLREFDEETKYIEGCSHYFFYAVGIILLVILIILIT